MTAAEPSIDDQPCTSRGRRPRCRHVNCAFSIVLRRGLPHDVAMHIQVIPNRGSPPAILLRESYREGGKVKKRTLLNLTHWPPELLEGFKALLKGGTVIPAPASPEVFTIRRALPHGHVAAVLGTLGQIGLDRILGPDGTRCRDLVIAMVAARLTDPTSKLATAKALSPETASSSLGAIMGLGEVDEDELYTAL